MQPKLRLFLIDVPHRYDKSGWLRADLLDFDHRGVARFP